MAPDDDALDGCDLDFGETPDEDLDGIVMFAGVAPADVEAHAAALRELAACEPS